MTNLSGANLNNGAAVGPQGEGRESPSSFPAYPAYKDSGVEWLGGLPQHWRFGCLKHALIELISGGTPESSNPAYWADGDGVPWVAISDMTKGLVINDTAKTITEDGLRSKGLRVIPAGGLLYSIYASIGKVAVLGLSAVTNQAILGLVVNGAVADQQFVRWWLVSLEGWVKTVSSSNTQDNLNAEKVRNLPLAFPSFTEQTQIASFLDHETARIDALIEDQQRLIELLKEKRQAVISHAVTKGLDPTVPMKDSGVEWLGEVPTHWKQIRIKHILKAMIDAEHKTAEYSDDGEYFVCRTTNVRNGLLSLEGAKYADRNTYIDWTRRGVPEPLDILFTREAPAGEACLVPESLEICLGQRMVLFKLDKTRIDPAFTVHSIYAGLASDFVKQLSQGSTVSHFNMADIGNIPLFEPSLPEQKEISDFLAKRCDSYDLLINEAESSVKLISERRSALISAAVTGKIDVRGWQPPVSIQAPKFEVAEAN